jgi:uncharacterized protein YegJ (DUF2314 family)
VRLAFAVLIAFLLIGCRRDPPAQVVERKGESDIVFVQASDREIEAAMAEARKELPYFIERLQHAKKREEFSIKARFVSDRGGGEYMWVSHLVYRSGLFLGKINSEPYDMKSLHKGSEVTFEPSQVGDWLIVFENKEYEGFFTGDALKRRRENATKYKRR